LWPSAQAFNAGHFISYVAINGHPPLREEHEDELSHFTDVHPPLEKSKAERTLFWPVPKSTVKNVIENALCVAFIR
jgi:hypothetical protein